MKANLVHSFAPIQLPEEIARFRANFPLSIKADTANQSERSR